MAWPNRGRDRTRPLFRAIPRPVRRMPAGRADPDLRPAAVHPGPGGCALVRPRVHAGAGTRSAASPGSSGRRRSRSSRRSGTGPSWSARPGSPAGVGSGRAAGRTSWTRRARRSPRSGSTGSCSMRAGRRRGSRRSSSPPSGRRRRRSGLLRVDLGDVPAGAAALRPHRPAAGARPDGPRQQRGLRGLAGRGDPRGAGQGADAVGAVPRLARLEYARAAAPGRPSMPMSGRLTAAGRAACRTRTATCSALDSSPSASTAQGSHANDPEPRPGRQPRGVPRLASRGARRRRPGGRAARDVGSASGRSSPRPATSSASGPSRANGPCSNASATSPTPSWSPGPASAGSCPRTNPRSSATTRRSGSTGSSTTRTTRSCSSRPSRRCARRTWTCGRAGR